MNAFTFDFVDKKIIGTKKAMARANKGMNPEFEELMRMMEMQPSFRVIEKTIKVHEGKKSYHGLTLERMQEYISLQSDSKEKLAEFETVKKVAKARGAQYPLTKQWFLRTYKEYTEKGFVIEEMTVSKEVPSTLGQNAQQSTSQLSGEEV